MQTKHWVWLKLRSKIVIDLSPSKTFICDTHHPPRWSSSCPHPIPHTQTTNVIPSVYIWLLQPGSDFSTITQIQHPSHLYSNVHWTTKQKIQLRKKESISKLWINKSKLIELYICSWPGDKWNQMAKMN